MKTIWKYPIEAKDEQFIPMPFGAEILCVQMQNGLPCLWALVESVNSNQPVRILVHGTGHEVDSELDALDYIGTFQLAGGQLVFHVFLP